MDRWLMALRWVSVFPAISAFLYLVTPTLAYFFLAMAVVVFMFGGTSIVVVAASSHRLVAKLLAWGWLASLTFVFLNVLEGLGLEDEAVFASMTAAFTSWPASLLVDYVRSAESKPPKPALEH